MLCNKYHLFGYFLVEHGNFFSFHRYEMTQMPCKPCFYQGLTKNEREQYVTHPFAPQINDITLMKKVFISSYA